MSETEINKGKLTLVGTLDNFVRQNKDKIKYEGDTVEETFSENFYNTHVLIDRFVYEIIPDALDFYDDIFEMSCDSSGDLHYLLKYYNGGCGFQEAIDQAYKNMFNKLNKEK